MKPDLYTKIVLTVIAIMLIMIARKQFSQPEFVVRAESSSGNKQFSVGPEKYIYFYVYDPQTREVVTYQEDGSVEKRIKLWELVKNSGPGRRWPALCAFELPKANHSGCPVLAFFARAGTMLPKVQVWDCHALDFMSP